MVVNYVKAHGNYIDWRCSRKTKTQIQARFHLDSIFIQQEKGPSCPLAEHGPGPSYNFI